jgi:hypothetical protein
MPFQQVDGRRHTRYKFAVASILGPRHSLVLSIAQHADMVLTTIGYSIAVADSMSYVAQRICAAQGTPQGLCFDNHVLMSIIFVSPQTSLPAHALDSAEPGVVWLSADKRECRTWDQVSGEVLACAAAADVSVLVSVLVCCRAVRSCSCLSCPTWSLRGGHQPLVS